MTTHEEVVMALNERHMTHGAAGYGHGCRCDECRVGHREKARRERARWALASPEDVPHGVVGYGSYGCRCAVCSTAAAESSLRGRKGRVGKDPVHHGTAYAYDVYRCRCDACKRAAYEKTNSAIRAINDGLRLTASHHGQQWTGAELETLAREDLTRREKAAMLGRTYNAVAVMSRRLRADPRVINAAGIPGGTPR